MNYGLPIRICLIMQHCSTDLQRQYIVYLQEEISPEGHTCKLVNYKLVSASVTYKIDHLFNNFITRPKLDCLTGKSIDKNYFLHMSTGQQESLFYPLYYLVTMQEINSIKSFLWKLKRQDSQSLTLMPFSSIPNDRILKHHRSLYPFQLC